VVRKRSLAKWSLVWLLLLMVVALAAVAFQEYKTSYLQSRYFLQRAGELVYEVRDGPSGRIWFPAYGPYNVQRVYTRLPEFMVRLKSRGY